MNTGLPLRAETVIALASPGDVMARLRDHFAAHGAVSGAQERWSAVLDFGVVEVVAGKGDIRFRVAAADPTSLAYLQWGVAERVSGFVSGTTPEIVWEGGTRPGAPLPYFRQMRVLRARQITPRMRRVTLFGNDLERFGHGGLHVRLLLPPERGIKPVWPVMGADGRQAWPAGPRPLSRVYTIRRIDPERGEVDIDFVLHEGDQTPGADFARQAVPGDVVGMTGPGGGEPRAAAWYLLAGDETALPAIARILEEMPADRKVVALVEIADHGERQNLRSQAAVELSWLSREGRPAGTTTLLADAIRAIDLAVDGSVFVWVGCEHAAARQIRAHLHDERGLARSKSLVAAYWRLGRAGEAGPTG